MGVIAVAGACLADRRSAKAKVARLALRELIVSFAHDRELKCYLPGIPPTGRRVVLPNVVVMGFDDDGRVAYEHIYWDQASLLVQIGLLDLRPFQCPAPSRRGDCSIRTSLRTN